MKDTTGSETTLEAARAILGSHLSPGGVRDRLLHECDGLFAARSVYAGRALPHDTTSTRDGFALRAVDTATATPERPVRLRVLDRVATAGGDAAGGAAAGSAGDSAGKFPASGPPLGKNEAIRVMTGALLPEGADAVVAFEELADASAETEIAVQRPRERGSYLRRAGSEVSVGEPVVARGEQIGPSIIGLAAALGQATLPVYERPRALVIGIGDELLEPGEPVTGGRLYNDGAAILASLLRGYGLEATVSSPIADRRNVIRRAIEHAVSAGYSLIVTTGGTGGGDHDLIRGVLMELTGELLVSRLALRPGGGTVFTMLQGTPCFALPGTPGAATMVCELLLQPAARIVLGSGAPENPKIIAKLSEPFERPRSAGGAARSGRSPVAVRPRRMQLYTAGAELRARPVPRTHLYRELRETNAFRLSRPGEPLPRVGDSIELELSATIRTTPDRAENRSELEKE